MIQPTYLKAGDTVGITCPAKKLTVAEIETAINIGFSCKLLNEKMELYLIDAITKLEVLN